jgi:hypothetical protein
LFERDASACIQLTRAFFSLSQKFGIVGKLFGFLMGMNPLEKGHPGFFWKLRDGFLNFLDSAHGS